MSKFNPLRLFHIELNPKRIFGLDVLRAFAIMVVVIGHGDHFIPQEYKGTYNYLIYDGVSIFFVLSGFLIGGILIKILENNEPTFATLKNFWMRRWLRTLPNYYLVLAILVAIAYSTKPNFNFWEYKSFLWFGQNFNSPHLPFFGEAWSLSIEEWFYLLIPISIFLLIWLFKIPPRYAVLIIAVLIILFVTNLRYIRYLLNPNIGLLQWDLLFRKQVVTRLDSLMYGIIGAYFAYYKHQNWIKHKVPLFLLGILMILGEKYIWKFMLPVTGINLYFCVFTFMMTSFGTLAVLPFLSEWKKTSSIFYKPVTYISLISYSMYLLNLNVMVMYVVPKVLGFCSIEQSAAIYPMAASAAYWIFTISCSILLYKFWEMPFMRLRDRIWK